ncbi:MAG: phosphotransferase [Planctomycetes bacterium]|nr:phosphotransferase [Planctomycetota bacterium]
MEPKERFSFDPSELAVVLSHFDIGVIESITEFPRGSRRSPKVGIVAERGKFLLKRRSVARARPDRIRLSHRVQAHLLAVGFPLPRLISTRDGRQATVQLRDHVYELFEFVAGQPFERTPEEALDAGKVLAKFHIATEPISTRPDLEAPQGDFHDASGVRTGLCAIRLSLKAHDSFTGDEAELENLVNYLLEAYDRAADASNASGYDRLPRRLIHADWHPGNILFRNRKVVAVVDYDSLRLSRRIADVANGAMQFSMIAGGDPAIWPDQLDEDRYLAFFQGYGSILTLSAAESACAPHLMSEALIAECVPPISETGSVGRWAGFRVMQMVRRKIAWLEANSSKLTLNGR